MILTKLFNYVCAKIALFGMTRGSRNRRSECFSNYSRDFCCEFTSFTHCILEAMMESHAESDEMLAQRLQAQEMGGYGGNINVNAQTPLVVRYSS